MRRRPPICKLLRRGRRWPPSGDTASTGRWGGVDTRNKSRNRGLTARGATNAAGTQGQPVDTPEEHAVGGHGLIELWGDEDDEIQDPERGGGDAGGTAWRCLTSVSIRSMKSTRS